MRPKANLLRAVALALPLVVALTSCKPALPAPDSDVYRQMVSAFFQGVAALEAGDDARAKEQLTRATQLVPEEGAAWANAGLLALRQRDFDAAASSLAKAAELAPDRPQVPELQGLLESSRGDSAKAIERYQHSIDLFPQNPKTLYALAAEIERQNAEQSDERAQQTYDKVLQLAPGNLAVLLDKARVAARRGDRATLDETVAAIGRNRAGWPAEAETQYAALSDVAANGPDVKAAGTRVAFLRNVLVRVPAYQASLLIVKTPPTTVGEPIDYFFALKEPSTEPAAPDMTIAFTVESALDGAASWAGPVYLSGDSAPVVAALAGSDLVVGPTVRVGLGMSSNAQAPHSAVFFDYDYDFDLDCAVATSGGLRIVEQRSPTEFVDVTTAAKLSRDVASGAYSGVWAADVDLDGDLDLVVGRTSGGTLVLVNNGDKTFAPSELFAQVRNVTDFAWVDIDDDGDPDAVFASDGFERVFRNERGNLFVDLSNFAKFPTTSVAVGDVLGDGYVNVVCVGAGGAESLLNTSDAADTITVTENFGGSRVEGDATVVIADLDNNGAVDLIVSGSDGARVRLGGPGRKLTDLPTSNPGRVTGAADLDGDGRLDLVALGADGKVLKLKNTGSAAYHWQDVRPRAKQATGDQRINSFGVGGSMDVRSALLFQRQPIASPVVHFGLGANEATEVARIVWPNGVVQAEFGLTANQAVLAEQRLKGSCPWLFAWNGSEMAFVTDFIWRSPLGLRINAQETAGVAQTEDWVKIRGDQLVAREGRYDLRITADLWETHFFDDVRLVAVDHPADTDVFVDERFAIPPPAHEVIATSKPEPIRAAVDDAGADVTDTLARRDGVYLDSFGRGRYQGVTREHTVEIELPDGAPKQGSVLLAYGWIHPTDSSINVAISQGANAPPTGLSLEALDPDGSWRVVRTGLGFPEGKNKTVVLDLDDALASGARRIRLRTNLEIYWDEIRWATRHADARPVSTECALDVADLRYRGFSKVTQANASSPELPDYGTISGTTQRWRDLVGYYTRFGDVRELIASVDDRYIIMNAGDEIVLSFQAPAAPPDGWVRDFVLVGDGWVKDGDFNTTFSTTVLPLPSHAQTAYDRRPTALEDDPVYRSHAADWTEYHTRYVTPDGFRLSGRPGGAR